MSAVVVLVALAMVVGAVGTVVPLVPGLSLVKTTFSRFTRLSQPR